MVILNITQYDLEHNIHLYPYCSLCEECGLSPLHHNEKLPECWSIGSIEEDECPLEAVRAINVGGHDFVVIEND
jgi:hypothetical protein